MLHEFLTANKAELIGRCRLKAGDRRPRGGQPGEDPHGVPVFLAQIIKTLQLEESPDPQKGKEVSGPSDGGPAVSEIGASATLHGRALSARGFTVDEVVHNYGDLCQAISDMACERGEPVTVDEFRTLNRCLDNGIADAVTEFSFQRGSLIEQRVVSSLNEQLGLLTFELRSSLHAATLAVAAIKEGNAGLAGSTAKLLDRSLTAIRILVDQSLTNIRISSGMSPRHRLVALADLISDIELYASPEAKVHRCSLRFAEVDPVLAIEVDRDTVFAALSILLQNAFKFTRLLSRVTVSAYAAGARINIEVQDECGGLPAGADEYLADIVDSNGDTRSAFGFGLTVCKQMIETNGGQLTVRDLPGIGCTFTIVLPRHQMA